MSHNPYTTQRSHTYYIQDYLGSTRMVVTSTNTIKETINYHPYGRDETVIDQTYSNAWKFSDGISASREYEYDEMAI